MDETSRTYKLKRRHMIADVSGKCPYCPPHRGENSHGKQDQRWVDGVRRPRKNKEQK